MEHDGMPDLDVLKTKTVRFAKVVEVAGKPEPYTLWTEPARDKEFQKALREERLMTVLRQASKSETALVGFVSNPSASYLVFPKSVEEFADRRIVGVKYDLLAKPRAKGKPITVTATKPAAHQVPPRKAVRAAAPVSQRVPSVTTAPEPQLKPEPPPTFRVHARVIITVNREVEVQAKNQREARAAALKVLDEQAVDPSAGTTDIKIKKVSRKSGAM